MIHALVLAAGESRRMGMLKPLLRFGETTFLEQIIAVLEQCDVDGITVVLGAAARVIWAAIDLRRVSVVINETYQRGQLSSLIAGLREIPERADAVLLCLVDNPFVTAETVNCLVGAFHRTRKPIVVPVFEGRRGHPTLFARPMFDQLIHAPAEEGARHVLHRNKKKVLEIEVSDRTILTRIDTPEDYSSHFGGAPCMGPTSRAREER